MSEAITFNFQTPSDPLSIPASVEKLKQEASIMVMKQFDVFIKGTLYRIKGDVTEISDPRIDNGFFKCSLTVEGTKRKYK